MGACEISRVVSQVWEMSNHLARVLDMERVGQGGMEKLRISFFTKDQSIRAQ